MSNPKACYFFLENLNQEVRDFLAHHKLSEKFDMMVSKVKEWALKMPFSTFTPSLVYAYQDTKTSAGDSNPSKLTPCPGTIPHTGGFMLSLKEKKRRLEPGLCMYCGQPGHLTANFPIAKKPHSGNFLSQGTSLLAAIEENKATNQLYASVPITLNNNATTWALLDIGALANLMAESVAKQLGLSSFPLGAAKLADVSILKTQALDKPIRYGR